MSATASSVPSARTTTDPPGAASRAGRSRPGSTPPGAPGRGRPRPRTRPARRPARPRTRAPRPRAGGLPGARRRRGRPARAGPRTRCAASAPGRAGRGRAARACGTRAGSCAPRPRRERALTEALGVAADRRQRRLQLVAHREQEVPLGLTGVGELLGHLVERLREGRELAGAGLGKRRVRRSAASAWLAVGDPPDRTGDRAGDEERERAGEGGARERGEQQVTQERLPRGGGRARAPEQEQPARGQRPVRVDVPVALERRLAVARAVRRPGRTPAKRGRGATITRTAGNGSPEST